MGKCDETMYNYLSEPERFADLFNAGCFHGRQLVEADKLEQLAERVQISEVPKQRRSRKYKTRPKSIYRDIRMKLPDGTKFIILAVEDQQVIDYEMPWRIMRYDCADYENQINAIHRRKRRDREARSSGKTGRFKLSEKMDASDRLIPVFTICFYHGTEPWTGPRSLRDMMEFGENAEKWKELFADYQMIFVDAGDPALAANCRTDLKLLLDVLRLRGDKERMLELLQGRGYANVSKETAETIAVMAGMPEMLENMEQYENAEGGGYKMCIAMDGIREDARMQGISQGISQGIKIISTIQSSRREGKEELDIKKAIIEEYGLTPEDADGYMVIR
ncbi:MAG: hypothetical protein IJ794_17375 [Lachnospiraceae bacterium]|nr:hypothetical protein [Lachnospiraceae bacterium]